MSLRSLLLIVATLGPMLLPAWALLAAEIHDAADRQRFDQVKALVAADPKLVHARDGLGWTPLHWAVFRRDQQIIRFLLDHGAKVNPPGNPGTFTPLHLAAEGRSHAMVELLIARGADINAPVPHAPKNSFSRQRPLHRAAQRDYPKIVELLLGKGAKVDARDDHGQAPLHLASVGGAAGVVRLLLQGGADVGVKTTSGQTPLHYAMLNPARAPTVAEVLLAHKADPNAPDSTGRTPVHDLHRAGGNLDLLRLLIEHGGDVHAKSRDGTTLLWSAAVAGRHDVLAFLLKRKAEVNVAQKGTGRSILFWPVNHGDYRTVKTLLAHGVAPRYLSDAVRHAKGDTRIVKLLLDHGAEVTASPLQYAVQRKNPAMARLLLQYKANPNAAGRNGLTPIHTAVVMRNLEMLKLLLAHGGNINAPDRSGRTPLHDVVERGSADWVGILAKHGADVNRKGRFGVAPLHLAAAQHKIEMVRALLKHKADPRLIGSDHQTPLHMGAWQSDKHAADLQIAKLLLDRGADPTIKDTHGMTPLWRAQFSRRKDLVQCMLDEGVKPDVFLAIELGMHEAARQQIRSDEKLVRARHFTGETPLHFAARKGLGDLAAQLLKRKAEVNATGKSRFTPLHVAALYGRVEVAKQLIAAGANLAARTKPGWHFIGGINRVHNGQKTPLHLAVQGKHREMVRLLLENKAGLNASNNFGRTPLHDAVISGDPAMVALLLEHQPELNPGCSAIEDVMMQGHPGMAGITELTPLKLAKQLGHKEIAKLLAERGAKEQPDPLIRPVPFPALIRP